LPTEPVRRARQAWLPDWRNFLERPIRYAQISREDFATTMRQADVPQVIAALLDELFAKVLDGAIRGSWTASSRRLAGWRDYARTTAATGIWGPESCCNS
jgi:hypothetical protein